MKKLIEKEIVSLKLKHFNVCDGSRYWMQEENGYGQEETKRIIIAQINVLEKILNKSKNEGK